MFEKRDGFKIGQSTVEDALLECKTNVLLKLRYISFHN